MDSASALGPAPERRIGLSGPVNFRDLGGYDTVDGRRVRWRRVLALLGAAQQRGSPVPLDTMHHTLAVLAEDYGSAAGWVERADVDPEVVTNLRSALLI